MVKRKRGLLVIISGPSGVGKSTVVKRLIKIYPKLKVSVSATTRPPRPAEKDGTDYIFLKEKDFFKQVKDGGFLEWAQVHGFYYGTPRELIEEEVKKGQIVVLEVDVQGATTLKTLVNEKKLKSATVFIFLIPPSVDILAFRLKRRKTEDTEALNYRLRAAIAELQVMEKYDYIVVNDKVETAASKMKAIINVEKERVLLN